MFGKPKIVPSINNPEETCQDQPKNRQFIGEIDQAPEFVRGNPYLISGYRINFDTIGKNFNSMFMIHNETVNIWTHLLPAFILMVVASNLIIVIHQQHVETIEVEIQDICEIKEAYYDILNISATLTQSKIPINKQSDEHLILLQQNKNNHNTIQQQLIQSGYFSNIEGDNEIPTGMVKEFTDLVRKLQSAIFGDTIDQSDKIQEIPRWPMLIYFVCAMLCLLFSTIFHVFYPISKGAYAFLVRLDVCGVSLLGGGISFPFLYYSMYCQMNIAAVYMTAMSTMAVSFFALSLTDWFHRPQNNVGRVFILFLMGMTFFIPVGHILVDEIVFNNYGDPFSITSSMPYYRFACGCFTLGAIFFIGKCPERNNPRQYDICGHSHQIWHMLVVIGMIFTFMGHLDNYHMRTMSTCPT